MIPKVKSSCFIFLLPWLLSLAYLTAITEFGRMHYVPAVPELNMAYKIVILVCVITAVLAFWGICLVFFDVTHFVCVLLYSMPLVFVVPSLCAVALTEIGDAELITNESIKRFIIQDWKIGNKPPGYLLEPQLNLACCGLNGPRDYRTFIYDTKCKDEPLDVPLSCYNFTTFLLKPPPLIIMDACRGKESKTEIILNLRQCNHRLFENVFKLKDSTEETNNRLTREMLCQHAHNESLISIKEEYREIIHHEGCLDHIITLNQAIVNGNFVVLIASALLSLTMLIVFLKNWCSSQQFIDLLPTLAKTQLSEETLIHEDTKQRSTTKAKKSI